MIKAVIFDVYGVLVTDSWHPLKYRYFKDDPEKGAEASRLNDLSNKGALEYRSFLQMVADLAGVNVEKIHQEMSHSAANLQLFNFIEELKPTYKIGLLSNAAENRLDELFTPEQLGLFDATVLSCDIGANKPETKAYEAVAHKLGYDLSECLFIDDIKVYTDASTKIGMKGIQYRDPEQAIAEIRKEIS